MSRELIRLTTIAQVAVLLLLATLALGRWPEMGLLALSGTLLLCAHLVRQRRMDPLAAYRDAQNLLRQLIDLSGGLDTGLDATTLGGGILAEVGDALPARAVTLYVPRAEGLTPLVSNVVDSTMNAAVRDAGLRIAEAVHETRTPAVADGFAALPLTDGQSVVGVAVAELSERLEAQRLRLDDQLRALAVRLRPSAVHLETALLFASFRDAATTEERRRLAREMHDGVAQDLASLGYLVDALAFRPECAASPALADGLATLRGRLSGVVSEVRRSLVNLRTTVGASESLGQAIGSIARHLSEVSGVPIEVTVDEQTERLRPEVEGELFRIAQEAMTNAVKHAGGELAPAAIEVHCLVRSPQATVTVIDHGPGLRATGGSREGSHGLQIMRERALLINGEIDFADTPGGGLTVAVRVPASVPAGARLTPVSDSARVIRHESTSIPAPMKARA